MTIQLPHVIRYDLIEAFCNAYNPDQTADLPTQLGSLIEQYLDTGVDNLEQSHYSRLLEVLGEDKMMILDIAQTEVKASRGLIEIKDPEPPIEVLEPKAPSIGIDDIKREAQRICGLANGEQLDAIEKSISKSQSYASVLIEKALEQQLNGDGTLTTTEILKAGEILNKLRVGVKTIRNADIVQAIEADEGVEFERSVSRVDLIGDVKHEE